MPGDTGLRVSLSHGQRNAWTPRPAKAVKVLIPYAAGLQFRALKIIQKMHFLRFRQLAKVILTNFIFPPQSENILQETQDSMGLLRLAVN